jgi:hypothetical protein
LRPNRPAVLVALAAITLGCALPTESRPKFVSEAGAFSALLSNSEGLRRLGGNATIDTAADGSLIVRMENDGEFEDVVVEFFSGMNGTNGFDFAVGEHSLVGLVGVQELNARVSIIPIVTGAPITTYHAGTGYIEIVESTPAGIVARFEFRAAGGTSSPVNSQIAVVRGSFSALPITD